MVFHERWPAYLRGGNESPRKLPWITKKGGRKPRMFHERWPARGGVRGGGGKNKEKKEGGEKF